MNRLPIRVRLSLGFALVMAVLLAVVGTFVYSELRRGLDDTIDRELSARLAGAIAIVRDDGDDLGDPARDPLVRIDPGGYVQVLDPAGRVVGATSTGLGERPLVQIDAITGRNDELEGELVPARDVDVPELDRRLRVAAAIARDDGVDYTVVAGASLDQRDETLSELRQLLWIGGPILLLLTTLAGYLIAAGALRPVEVMRERAAGMSATNDERLPVPPSRDEIARLGETLNQMLDRIEASFERERVFVADASHELRTPLAVLRAELDLALADGRSPEEMSLALASALEETDRLVALADQLLVLARSDAGGLPVDSAPVDLGELARTVASRFEGAAERMAVEVADPSPTAEVDSTGIDQAVSNLIQNAITHGGGDVTLTVSRHGERAEIHVLDDGPGFAEPLLDSAFERFERGPVRDRTGTGLGLSIAAAIARAHGGDAGLSNRREGGADVWISVPLTPPERL